MIKGILGYIKRKKMIINTLHEISDCLSPGEYVIDKYLRFIYLQDQTAYRNACALVGKNYLKPIVKAAIYCVRTFLFRSTMIIERQGKENEHNFCGTVCYIGIDRDSSIKVFDFNNKKVLTFYMNPAKYMLNRENSLYFKSYFNIPELLYTDDKRCIMIERLVRSKPVDASALNDVIKRVFVCYNHYFIKVKESCSYDCMTFDSVLHDKEDEISDFILRNIDDELKKVEYPYLKLHGDLWLPNIIMDEDKGEIYYIDFEMADAYVFFYDLFWLITEQAFIKNKFSLIRNYLLGDYDHYFMNIFHIFGLEFNTLRRLDYLNIFFLEFYMKRWRTSGSKKMVRQFNEYKRFLNKIAYL